MRIGVFDSGVGGITVLTELRRKFPSARFVYLGDTANVPYGPKSPEQIRKLSREGARLLKARGVDSLVVACNTASSLALEEIREEMGAAPVIGVVAPGVEAVLSALQSQNEGVEEFTTPILVLATSATVRSGAYGNLLRAMLAPAAGRLPLPIIEQACPLLVPMIEEGWIDHPILHQTLAEYVRPTLESSSPGVALLGCTHYPWIQAAFQKALPGWHVINSAHAVAEFFHRQTPGQASSLEPSIPTVRTKESQVEWVFTDPAAVPEFARRYMHELEASES